MTAPHFTTIEELEAGRVAALEHHAEAILNAAGTSLKHYTMPGNRARIVNAVSRVMNEAFAAGLSEGRVTLAHEHLGSTGQQVAAYQKEQGDALP